jgi:sialic acid synthase SpsE
VLATALGARIIEKHVSLEKNRPGFDNEMAASIEEFEQYVKDLRNAVQTLGSNEKVLSLDEISQIPKLRRSAHAARSLKAGESLSWDMIEFKRPGNGISISAVSAWIGVELVRSIPKGRLICEADFRVVS